MMGEGGIAYGAEDQWLGPVVELHRLSYRWLGQGEPTMDLDLEIHLIPLAQWLLKGRGRSTPSGPINGLHIRIEAMDHLTLAGRIRAPWGGWSGFSAEVRVSVDDEGFLELQSTRAHLPDPLTLPGPVPSLWPLSLLTRRLPSQNLERLGPHRVRVPLMDCVQAFFEESGLELPMLPSTFTTELSFHRARLGLSLSTTRPLEGGEAGRDLPGDMPLQSQPLRDALAEVPEFSESIEADDGKRVLLSRIDHALAFGHWNEAAEAWQRLKSDEPDLLFGVGGADIKRRWLWLAEATDLIPEALHRVRQLVYAPDVGLEALGALSRHHRRQDAPIRAMLYLRQAWDSIGEVMPASLGRWAVGQSLISCLERIRSPEATRVRPELDQIEALLRSEVKAYAQHRPPPCVIEAEELGEEHPEVEELAPEEEPAGQAEPQPEPDSESEPEIDSEPEPEIDSEPEPEIDSEPEPEIDSEPEPEIDSEPEYQVTQELPSEVLPEPEEEQVEEDDPPPDEDELRAFRQVLGEAASLYGIVMDPETFGTLGPTPEEGEGEGEGEEAKADIERAAGESQEDTPHTLDELQARAQNDGQWGPYLEALEEALAEGGEAESSGHLRALSKAYLSMGMPSRAEKTLGELISLGPDDPNFAWAADTLGGIYQDGGRLREGLRLELTLIGQRFPGARGLVHLRALADEARRQDLGDVEGEILRVVLREDGEDDISLERLDSLLKARGAWLELAEVWGERGGEQGILRQAEAYVEAGALDQARALLEGMIEDHPDPEEARRRLEVILRLQGELGEEGEPQALGLDQIEARLDRLEANGLPPGEDLALALNEHLKAQPRDRRGVHALVRLYGLKGSLEDAVALLDDLSRDLSQGGPMRAHWLRELGDVYLVHLGDPDKALAFYEQADALGDG